MHFYSYLFEKISVMHVSLLSTMVTEPEPETESGIGTVRTIFREPKLEPFLLKSIDTDKKELFQRGTVGTKNRNHSNRPMHEP